jgi:hypothetical protein
MSEQGPKIYSGDIMERSIQKGTEFLNENNEDIKIRLFDGGWDFTEMENEAAEKLDEAINRDEGHSGHSFGFALKGTLAAAENYGYTVSEEIEGTDKIITLKKG